MLQNKFTNSGNATQNIQNRVSSITQSQFYNSGFQVPRVNENKSKNNFRYTSQDFAVPVDIEKAKPNTEKNRLLLDKR